MHPRLNWLFCRTITWLHRAQWAVPKVSLDSSLSQLVPTAIDKATASKLACITHWWYVLVQFLRGLSRTEQVVHTQAYPSLSVIQSRAVLDRKLLKPEGKRSLLKANQG